MRRNIKAFLVSLLLIPFGEISAVEQRVYLYTMFHDDNSSGERFRTVMADMDQCLEVLKYAKMPMPEKPSGDYEVIGAMWCGSDMERNSNATWWQDETKQSRK